MTDIPGATFLCPAELAGKANTTLEALGFGPGNFSVPLDAGPVRGTYLCCHAWGDKPFLAAVRALTGIVEMEDDGPIERSDELIASRGLSRRVEVESVVEAVRTAR